MPYNRRSRSPTLDSDNTCPRCGSHLAIRLVEGEGRRHPVGTRYLVVCNGSLIIISYLTISISASVEKELGGISFPLTGRATAHSVIEVVRSLHLPISMNTKLLSLRAPTKLSFKIALFLFVLSATSHKLCCASYLCILQNSSRSMLGIAAQIQSAGVNAMVPMSLIVLLWALLRQTTRLIPYTGISHRLAMEYSHYRLLQQAFSYSGVIQNVGNFNYFLYRLALRLSFYFLVLFVAFCTFDVDSNCKISRLDFEDVLQFTPIYYQMILPSSSLCTM